jgi:hypothetical protein
MTLLLLYVYYINYVNVFLRSLMALDSTVILGSECHGIRDLISLSDGSEIPQNSLDTALDLLFI